MMIQKILTLSVALSSMVGVSAAWAGHGAAKIAVSLSPAGSFEAESGEVNVKGFAAKSGAQLQGKDIVLDLDTLKTGISLRDTHMKEKYFETQKPGHKEAVLTNATGSGGKWSGDLKIRNVVQKVSGTYEVNDGKWIGKFKTKLSDFKIPPAKYMGVGVEDEVEVEVSLPENGVGSATPAPAPAGAAPKKKSSFQNPHETRKPASAVQGKPYRR